MICMVVAREVLLISQGVILDHFGNLFFAREGGDAEVLGRFFEENLEGVEIFEWVRQQRGWKLALHRMYAHTTRELGKDDAVSRDKGVVVTDDDQSCKWPHCDEVGSDKDHILPNSGLRGGVELLPFAKPFKQKFGEGWNGQYLCEYHNRAVKLNSVGIGLAFLMLKMEE